MEIPILTDLTLILGIAVLVILLLHRLKLPTVIGFLISGIICGPYTLHLISSEAEVEMLSEIGIVLLLFTIGLEFSISGLMRIRRAIFIGGLLQLVLTIAVFTALAYYISYDYLPIALFIGFVFSLSSSAIVLKLLQSNGDIKKEHGKVILAILICQDVAVVPMMLTFPLLTGASENMVTDILVLTAKVAGVFIFILVSMKYIIPKLLYQIAKTKSKDLFIVGIMVLCFAIAWITSKAGLSLALGAFLAGLMISESKYGYEAVGIILPFKEIFTSIFFVSIGMMMDLNFLIQNLGYVLLFTFVTMFAKALIGAIAAAALRKSFKTIILTAINICQIGEFSFVLMNSGSEYGLLPIEIHQYLLAVAILTMAITPLLMTFDEKICKFIIKIIPVSKKTKAKWMGNPEINAAYNVEELENHIVIIGYGLAGQSLAHCALASQIPYVIIELNAKTVEEAAKAGIPIIYGDACNEEVLHHANIGKAKVAVITTIATTKAAEITYHLRRFNEKLSIIARTKQLGEMENLRRHGADAIIVDELESKLEAIMMVMSIYDVPEEHIREYTSAVKELIL